MHRSLITSTVIGTSAVIGALAFSADGAIARTDSLGVSQQQAFKEAGDLLVLIRGGGGGGGHGGGIAGAGHGFGGGHMGGVASPMTPTSPMQAAPLPGGVLSHARPTAGLPGRMLPQPVPGGAMRSPAVPTVTPPPNTTMGNSRSSAAAAAALAAALGTSGIPPAPPATVMPPPEIAQPQPELAPLAPISPQLPTQFSSGGTVQPNMALSPDASSSASPSGSAPSTPGGGGKSLADCMGFWDRATHMSKAEWKTACVRSMEDDPSVTG
jgi:hypothetical protein